MFSILEMLEFGIYLDEVKSEVQKTLLQYKLNFRLDLSPKYINIGNYIVDIEIIFWLIWV